MQLFQRATPQLDRLPVEGGILHLPDEPRPDEPRPQDRAEAQPQVAEMLDGEELNPMTLAVHFSTIISSESAGTSSKKKDAHNDFQDALLEAHKVYQEAASALLKQMADVQMQLFQRVTPQLDR